MFNNILIPTDGSELSQRAVQMAVALAKVHGARITGIHVIPDYHLLIAYEGAFDPVTEERIAQVAFTAAPAGISIGELAEATLSLPATAPSPVLPNASLKRVGEQTGVWEIVDGRLRYTVVKPGAQGLDGLLGCLEAGAGLCACHCR
mgnify:CR=1 FL=1